MRAIGRLIVVLLVLVAGAAAPVAAADCPHTPRPGSAERKALMDTLRKPVMAELNQRVVFVVHTLRVCGEWAFIEASPQQPSGKPVVWRKTLYADAVRQDMCGGMVHSLLVKTSGRWRVKTHVVCATDVPWVAWAEDFGAPRKTLPRLQ